MLLDVLADAGCQKLNLAGGEPTLHLHCAELIQHAKQLGMTTSVVTNGARLERVLESAGRFLDWVGLSLDSSDDDILNKSGRGTAGYVESTVRLADLCRSLGVRLKMNTVVHALNWREDMKPLVRRIRPERWKVLQVLPIRGQNDGNVEKYLISKAEFDDFVSRHQSLADQGIRVVPEDNDAMIDSYAMVDPLGRFFGNTGGEQTYSRPILDVGIAAAWREINFSVDKFVRRGGDYEWERLGRHVKHVEC